MNDERLALRSEVAKLTLRGATLDNVRTLLSRAWSEKEVDFDLAEDEFRRLSTLLLERETFRRVAAEKALWMAAVRRRLAKQEAALQPCDSTKDAQVEICENITPAVFFRDYYFRNKPVVMPGFADRWQSFAAWKVPALLERFGDEVVEITADREKFSDYDENVDRTRQSMMFREFVEMLYAAAGRETNDFYMVARNMNLRKRFGPLVAGLAPLPGILDTHHAELINFWIGPAGTVTRLHHDLTNVLFLQLSGSKRMRFVPPWETELVYNRHGVIADADVDAPDYRRFPRLEAASVTSATLQEGDAIFIPVGWWHQVRSLSQSVSLTFINFVVPNYFDISEHLHGRGASVRADV